MKEQQRGEVIEQSTIDVSGGRTGSRAQDQPWQKGRATPHWDTQKMSTMTVKISFSQRWTKKNYPRSSSKVKYGIWFTTSEKQGHWGWGSEGWGAGLTQTSRGTWGNNERLMKYLKEALRSQIRFWEHKYMMDSNSTIGEFPPPLPIMLVSPDQE